MRLLGAASSQRRPLIVAAFGVLFLAIVGYSLPASATTTPNGSVDPGQASAYRKLHAVAVDAYARKILPISAVNATKRIANGVSAGSASANAAARASFWSMVAGDLGQPIPQVQNTLKSGKSIRDLATAKQWKTLHSDVRAWAIHDLDLELFPNNGHPPIITFPKYKGIRARIYAATDTILTVRVPKPKPTPSPKPTKTPKPKPTPTPKATPTPTPKPTRTPKVGAGR